MLRGFRPSPDLPPVWMAGFALLAWALARWLPLWRFDAGPAGLLAVVVGMALILWAGFWFWRKDTPIEPGHAPRALIVEGPYRLNRNPIYTGLALVLAGFAVHLGAATALIPALAYPALVSRRFIHAEEAALRSAFGPEAEAYLARTRRW